MNFLRDVKPLSDTKTRSRSRPLQNADSGVAKATRARRCRDERGQLK